MCRIVCPAMTSIVLHVPKAYIPAPMAMPIAIVISTPVVVVIPLACPCFPIQIRPPPRIPTPPIMLAATLDTSTLISFSSATLKNPY